MKVINNFSVDDIHSIREEQTKRFNAMSNEKLKKYFREEEKKFYDSKVFDDNLVLL